MLCKYITVNPPPHPPHSLYYTLNHGYQNRGGRTATDAPPLFTY